MSELPESLIDSAKRLEQLIKMLFPDPHPELLTFDSYKERYKLRDQGKLTQTAVNDIEQSQRINRAKRDYKKAGLCEFHIGLIYLDVEDYRGARQQFEQARQQWSLVSEPAAIPLAYLAEGMAQQLALHQEAAMRCYNQASKRLPRIKFVPPSRYDEQFVQKLIDQLQAVQDVVHEQLWPTAVDAEEADTQSTDEAVGTDERKEAISASPTGDSRPRGQAVSDHTSEAEVQPEAPIVNLPIINYDTHTTPIPEHRYLGTQYEWYCIKKQPTADFFPSDVQKGAWILVDKTPTLVVEELVLVVADDDLEQQNDRIIVSSVRQERPFPHIYLAWLKNIASQPIESANISYAPEVAPRSIQIQEIIGVIVGIWLPVRI